MRREEGRAAQPPQGAPPPPGLHRGPALPIRGPQQHPTNRPLSTAPVSPRRPLCAAADAALGVADCARKSEFLPSAFRCEQGQFGITLTPKQFRVHAKK